MENKDKESKSVLSEKKIVDIPIVPSPTPEQPQEHSPAPISFTNAQQPTFPDPHSTSPAHLYQHLHQLHKEKPNTYYLRPSKPLHNLYNTTTILYEPSTYLNTNATNDRNTQVGEQNIPQLFESPIVLNTSFLIPVLSKFPPKFNDVMLPRPMNGPQMYPKRRLPIKMIARYPNMPPMRGKPFKKFFPRSPYQGSRPYNIEFDSPSTYFPRQQPIAFMSPPAPVNIRPAPIKSTLSDSTIFGTINEIGNVEISPQQASTEREPEIQTASSSNLIEVTPTFIRPAVNTGFKPSSIKMETGFKPIITKEIQDRADQTSDEIEINDEGATGIIDKDNENNYEYKPIHAFEPMFFPSPTDKFVKEKNRKVIKRLVNKKPLHYFKVVIKQPRSINEAQDELVAEAAERAETYYLPPKGQIPVDTVRVASNIDIENLDSNINIDSPPDVVVTYDGKRVSGQSLTAKISDRPTAFETRISKASTYIKARPQFVKYSGELPPLNPELLFGGIPPHNAGVLSRELDTPPLPVSSIAPSSTKLSRVTNFRQGSGRQKRAAHHTAEHTAQQQRENQAQQQKASAIKIAMNIQVSVFLVAVVFKCFVF